MDYEIIRELNHREGARWVVIGRENGLIELVAVFLSRAGAQAEVAELTG